MKKCHLCGNIPPILDRTKIDNHLFCDPCAKKYLDEKKDKEISVLLKEKPTIFFKISEVKTESPINPYDILHGVLIFTSRAVYFITLSVNETKVMSLKRIANDGGAGLVGLAIGSVFSKFADLKTKKASKLMMDEDLFQILKKSKYLLIFPKNNIKNISYGWNYGLRFDLEDGFIDFNLKNKKKDYKKYEININDYNKFGNKNF